MRRNAWRWFLLRTHKWVGIGIGIVLVMWLVTGLVMIQPKTSGVRPPAIDYASVTISPAEAVAAARPDAVVGSPQSLELRQLGPVVFYQVRFPRRPPVLIDGRTGESIEVTESLARSSVEAMLGRADVGEPTLLRRHGSSYTFGPLPAYQFTMDDPQGTMVHVALANGQTRFSTRRARLIGAFGSWHTFRALQASRRVEHGLLMVTSLVGLFSVVTGYLIAFRRRSRGPKRDEVAHS